MGMIAKTVTAATVGAYLMAAGGVSPPVSQETIEHVAQQVQFAATDAPQDFRLILSDPGTRQELQGKYKAWANAVSEVTWIPLAQRIQGILFDTFKAKSKIERG